MHKDDVSLFSGRHIDCASALRNGSVSIKTSVQIHFQEIRDSKKGTVTTCGLNIGRHKEMPGSHTDRRGHRDNVRYRIFIPT